MRMTGRMFVLAALVLLCGAVPLAAGLGYAPITIEGEVARDGAPVGGAEVVLEAELEDRVASSGSVVTDEDGSFGAAVTVPDGASVDVQVLIRVDGELFVEVVRDAGAWEQYDLVFDLGDGRLEREAPSGSGSSPTPPGFDEDMRALRDPSVPYEPIVEKYNATVEQYEPAKEPVREEPALVEDGSEGPSVLVWVAVAALVACLVVVHLEMRRR